ncbi:intraflagellar transport protein 80 homolog [Copidosoma floridanum]|uniref:intraflagellar transport protein 80 homolog n=1 Tax=Copidosoma floridanum TaxID=29053 RepID=UPI0006C98EDD|nr:intraflagellar transport protein 80 homolog [Copidosoma floridanum]
MRFKISQKGPNCHRKMVTCVTWSASDEIFSCGDDHQLICWKFEGGVVSAKVIAEFPDDFYPTGMQWHPRPSQPTSSGALKKQSMDVLLITTDDGKFHLVNRTGRIEKTVAAHSGATLAGKWSYDGTALYTAGEDGQVKVWSRSGMLRSTVIRDTEPVHASAWSPDNSAILYSQGPFLLIQSLTTSSKPHKWHAHEGLVLVACWNQFHGLIVSGGEDCRHKVWDPSGNLVYASAVGEQPVTSVSWCFSGGCFAVGSFDTLKLCDKTGWSHSLEKVRSGSVYDIGWSSDGTQVALACSNGAVLVAHTIEKKVEYNRYEASLVKRKAVRVVELGSEVSEVLEIADRVIQLEFGFEHLVVVTPSQCHVYSVANWNTPAIFELKNGSVSAVLMAEKHFLLVEWSLLSLYSYQGRSLGVPKWKGMTSEPLYPPCTSLCSDTLVVRDQSNRKLVHVLEISTKKPITEAQSYTHVQDVTVLALNYIGGPNDRQLALIDANRDLFLVSIRSSGFGRVCKIAGMGHNIAWAIDANVLAGMLDSTLSVWLCPNCVHYSDRKIIRKTRIDKDSSEYGKHPSIVRVESGRVTVRRGDGALVVSSFYTFFINLHRHVLNGKWEEAVSLCRVVQNETLWTCMAVMAIDSKQLDIAEEACAAIGRYDKVDYIKHIKKITDEIGKLSETYALMGDLQSAEGLLLQNGRIPEAIEMNVATYRWSRALELAIKHKRMLEEVLDERKRYLGVLGKPETSADFRAALHGGSKEAKKEAREKEREAREREKEEKRIALEEQKKKEEEERREQAVEKLEEVAAKGLDDAQEVGRSEEVARVLEGKGEEEREVGSEPRKHEGIRRERGKSEEKEVRAKERKVRERKARDGEKGEDSHPVKVEEKKDEERKKARRKVEVKEERERKRERPREERLKEKKDEAAAKERRKELREKKERSERRAVDGRAKEKVRRQASNDRTTSRKSTTPN